MKCDYLIISCARPLVPGQLLNLLSIDVPDRGDLDKLARGLDIPAARLVNAQGFSVIFWFCGAVFSILAFFPALVLGRIVAGASLGHSAWLVPSVAMIALFVLCAVEYLIAVVRSSITRRLNSARRTLEGESCAMAGSMPKWFDFWMSFLWAALVMFVGIVQIFFAR